MSEIPRTCKAITKTTKAPCKNRPRQGEEYCHLHYKRTISLKKEQSIEKKTENKTEHKLEDKSQQTKQRLTKTKQETKDIDYTPEEIAKLLKPLPEAFEKKKYKYSLSEDWNDYDDVFDFKPTNRNIYKQIIIQKLSDTIHTDVSDTEYNRRLFNLINKGILIDILRTYGTNSDTEEFLDMYNDLKSNVNNSQDIVYEQSMILYETLRNEYGIYAISQENTKHLIHLSLNSIMFLTIVYFYSIFVSESIEMIYLEQLVNNSTLAEKNTRDILKTKKEVLSKFYIEMSKSDDPVFKLVRSKIIGMFVGDEEDLIRELEATVRQMKISEKSTRIEDTLL